MKRLIAIFVFVLMITQTTYAEDMHKYLNDTQILVQEGKHGEALERFVWFHNHALEHQPSMYGVRLSFALSYWKQLGDIYPPALTAMEKVRNNKTLLLLQQKGNPHLFHDVASLNNILKDDAKTVELFRKLDEQNNDLAKKCWNAAKDAIIKHKAYDLARKYIGNPVREWGKVKEMYDYNCSLYDNPQIGGGRFKAYNENNLVEESLKLINVALALGDQKAAKEIQTKALSVVDDYRLEDAIPKKKK